MWIDYKGYIFMIVGSREQGYDVSYRKYEEEERITISVEKTRKKAKEVIEEFLINEGILKKHDKQSLYSVINPTTKQMIMNKTEKDLFGLVKGLRPKLHFIDDVISTLNNHGFKVINQTI